MLSSDDGLNYLEYLWLLLDDFAAIGMIRMSTVEYQSIYKNRRPAKEIIGGRVNGSLLLST
jgi:hypothetical protein